ncbi:MAG: type IV secretory system conjugative DNA transfer family protein [Eubacteriales bacterium]|nr:type IV secretory system conjugative DNA transfer family protein [Eubacteriales bacterium]
MEKNEKATNTAMHMDPVVLGKGFILPGDDVGISRPNDNILVDGCSGAGKTTSTMLPTMLKMTKMNLIATFAKEEEAYQMKKYQCENEYHIDILNLKNPEEGTVSFDPFLLFKSYEDIEEFSTTVVHSTLEKTNDSYWNAAATRFSNGNAALSVKKNRKAGITEYFRTFDRTVPFESGAGFSTHLDKTIREIRQTSPDCYALRMMDGWLSLPFRTASCVRDTLASALNCVFPETIRKAIKNKPQVDLRKLATEKKRALYIISDASEIWQANYTNLFWSMAIRELRAIAGKSPGYHLPYPIRLYFGDFGCTSPIRNFEKNISVFRSAGISCFIVLQSQSQLESIYGTDKATIIRQNCPVQVYFPGGFDDRSCEIVSRRMNMPFEEVMYAPLGKVFIMQAGKKPVIVPRFETFQTPEYKEFEKLNAITPYK